jgi:hypothetical protein
MSAEQTTCPKCSAPIEPARRGHNSYFADQHGRGAGFSITIETPAACSDPACDWEDRPGITIPVNTGGEVYLRGSARPGTEPGVKIVLAP